MNQTTRIIDQIPGLEFESEIEKDYQATIDAIRSAFESSDDDHDWQIRVFEMSGPARRGFKQAFLFNCSVDDLPIDERLAREYGEGQYRCAVYHNNGIFKQFVRVIGRRPKSEAAPPPGEKSDLTLLVETIRAENQRTNEMFAQILTKLAAPPPAVPPAVNPLDMVTSMVAALKGLQDLAPKPAEAAGGASFKDFVDVFKSGMEIAKDAAGGGETGIADIFKALIQSPMAEKLINPNGAGQVAPNAYGDHLAPGVYVPPGPMNGLPPRAQPQTQPQPQGFPPVLPPDIGTMTPQQADAIVRGQLGFLVAQAKENRDPSLYAEVLLDQMPQAALEHILNTPGIIAELEKVVPEIAQHRHWFNRLLAAIRQNVQLEGDAEPEQPTGLNNGAGPGGGVA